MSRSGSASRGGKWTNRGAEPRACWRRRRPDTTTAKSCRCTTRRVRYAQDDGVREDSTVENLAKLKPFFDRKYGNVTAGNSSQITDGGAWLVIASERAVEQHKLTPSGRIVDSEWAGLDPAEMGLGPVHAATPILTRQGLGLNDLDAWEINEAFAAQVIGCERAGRAPSTARRNWGFRPRWCARRSEAQRRRRRIALGHPVGASGARIVLHLLNVLKRTGGRRGMAAICIGGGLGGAMLVERGMSAAGPPKALAPWGTARAPFGHTTRRAAPRANTGGAQLKVLLNRLENTPTASRRRLAMQHWTLARDADGIARLALDRAGSSTNTLGAPVLAELNEALDQLDRDPPRGLVIVSGKASGFIAGADVDEFKAIGDESAALALVKRGWDTFERLAAVKYPTVALVRGFCLGGGLELALACRYRIVVDEPGTRLGLPEVMLGIVPGWGGMKRLPRLTGAPAALDLMLTGRTIDARRAKRIGVADECVPARIMENTARGILTSLPPPRRLGFPLSLTLNPLARPIIAAQARKRSPRAGASTIPRRTRFSTSG
jgi:enoyl-CoA hydratase/carnithine racemase